MLGGYRGKGAVPWVCLQKYGKGALESDNQRSQEARSRGKSRRGGQAEEERVWVPPRLSLSCHQLHSKRPCKSSESGGLQSLVVAFRPLSWFFHHRPCRLHCPRATLVSESWRHAQLLGVICLEPKGASRHKQGGWQKIDTTHQPCQHITDKAVLKLESQWGQGHR